MHPVLFEIGSFTVYSYGFFIALGAVLGFTYMTVQGKRQFNLSFDQANTLFLLLVIAGVLGGKLFMLFEDLSYLKRPLELLTGAGFVLYGSLLTGIPFMLWYFRKNKIPVWPMLDVMAITICLLHVSGRIGCFMAGCCHGSVTHGIFGIAFTDPVCQARPLNEPLHPTQLYEAAFILIVMLVLLLIKRNKQFDGQLFLLYLIFYAIGRSVIELYRGDLARGFVIDNYLSNSQFISLIVALVAAYFYVRLRNTKLGASKSTDNGK